jgi:hypothetical protein
MRPFIWLPYRFVLLLFNEYCWLLIRYGMITEWISFKTPVRSALGKTNRTLFRSNIVLRTPRRPRFDPASPRRVRPGRRPTACHDRERYRVVMAELRPGQPRQIKSMINNHLPTYNGCPEARHPCIAHGPSRLIRNRKPERQGEGVVQGRHVASRCYWTQIA